MSFLITLLLSNHQLGLALGHSARPSLSLDVSTECQHQALRPLSSPASSMQATGLALTHSIDFIQDHVAFAVSKLDIKYCLFSFTFLMIT